VTEIEETRRQLESDLRELEGRLPAPLRSLWGLVGVFATTTLLSALVLKRLRGKSKQPSAEVVVRIVRDDLRATAGPISTTR